MTRFTPKTNDYSTASDWTPRQALMHALAIVDDFDMVVIALGNRKQKLSHGITATENAFERDGLTYTLLQGPWDV